MCVHVVGNTGSPGVKRPCRVKTGSADKWERAPSSLGGLCVCVCVVGAICDKQIGGQM